MAQAGGFEYGPPGGATWNVSAVPTRPVPKESPETSILKEVNALDKDQVARFLTSLGAVYDERESLEVNRMTLYYKRLSRM